MSEVYTSIDKKMIKGEGDYIDVLQGTESIRQQESHAEKHGIKSWGWNQLFIRRKW